jgi:hypothetical protein
VRLSSIVDIALETSLPVLDFNAIAQANFVKQSITHRIYL